MDTIVPTGAAIDAAQQKILEQNSAAVEDLLTRKERGSDLPSPIECRCFEKTDAKAEAR